MSRRYQSGSLLIMPERDYAQRAEPQAQRILVVDDAKAIANLCARALAVEGYQVSTAYDGKEGWDLYLSDPYELILTDIDMPRMNGLELLANILNHNVNAHVIFMSGNPNIYLEELLDAGAKGLISKPFAIPDLIEEINKYRK